MENERVSRPSFRGKRTAEGGMTASAMSIGVGKHSWGGRIRTSECVVQSHVPYHLATPHPLSFGADISPTL
jgi:hypothetical protein